MRALLIQIGIELFLLPVTPTMGLRALLIQIGIEQILLFALYQ